MVNQFYVDPANDFSGALMGLGNVIKDYRLEQEQRGKVKAAQERMAEVQSALGEAFNSGDPNKVAEIAIKYPEAQKTVELLYGFKSADTKKNLLDTGRAVLSNKNNPQGALAALNQRIEYLNKQGADPSHTMAARDELQRRIESGEDTADFFKNAEMGFASIASPQEWKAYSGETSGTNTPSDVLETEWFLKQPPKVQEAHIKLKRKTDPTMAEKLAYAQDIANLKVSTEPKIKELERTGTQNAEQRSTYKTQAIAAAENVPTLKRAIQLQEEIMSGGGANTLRKMANYLGVSSADEGELNSLFGQNILGQLKSTFGGNPTEGERLALEQAQASFTQTGKINIRLLNNALKLADLRIRRGRQAAATDKDEDTVKYIDDALSLDFGDSNADINLGGSGEGSMTPGAQPSEDYLARRKRLLGK